jgi:hypothetical protein
MCDGNAQGVIQYGVLPARRYVNDVTRALREAHHIGSDIAVRANVNVRRSDTLRVAPKPRNMLAEPTMHMYRSGNIAHALAKCVARASTSVCQIRMVRETRLIFCKVRLDNNPFFGAEYEGIPRAGRQGISM